MDRLISTLIVLLFVCAPAYAGYDNPVPAAAVTGTLGLANGGTGASSAGNALDILYGASTNTPPAQSFVRTGAASYAAQNQYCYNCDAVHLPHMQACMAQVKQNTANCLFLFVGDSTTDGRGGSAGNWWVTSFPTQIANALQSLQIPATANAFMGTDNTTYDFRPTVDPRIVVTSPWAYGGSTALGGNALYTSTASTSGGLSFTPTSPVDTFVFYYVTLQGSATAVLSANINGGTPITYSTVSTSVPQSLAKATITGTLGIDTLNLGWASGTIGVDVLGAYAYSSAQHSVIMMNAGANGFLSAGMAATGNPWSNLTAIPAVGANVTFIDAGINDWNQSVSVSAYTTNLTALAQAAKTSGDCVIVTPNPSSIVGPSLATQQGFVSAMYGVAKAQSCALVDNFSFFQSYEIQNPLGMYSDTLHPSISGYNLFASPIANLISQIGGVGNGPTVPPIFVQGTGSAIASAATISPIKGITHVTGTAAISTIVPPPGMTTAAAGTAVGGCIELIADGAWTTTTSGNIAAAITAVATPSPTPYQACYEGTKWYIH